MAISGTLSTLFEQCDPNLFSTALNYIESTDLDEIFQQVESGSPVEVEINGRELFAVFQSYETKSMKEAFFEGHKQYIDIQYIHSGTEQILVAPIERIVKDDTYNDTKDVYFPTVADFSTLRLSAGMGCILYPNDLHAPGVSVDVPSKIKKIVFKVAVK
ncbi:YhcH/YjgK/YiaL family protein [Carboxylicivirga caseinilyticus]|uniref:YhcH/YjgK/YiaL family protein n=1 Tax=Carboxylicivirga caseinilyticus TaxID=3417572 RepID=UPI003D33B8F5|nr:YhcH/YjgK/YiaL family protein [Marinilabiliaceae bacterium A049]